MIPSHKWFPLSLAERAAWYENFATQFAAVAISLGFTTNDINSVNNDNDVFQFLADAAVQIDAYKSAVGQYRRILTEGDVGEPTPQFPANPSLALPASVATGMFERLDKLRTKIMAADNYTDEIGALLKILPKQTEQIAEGEVKPKVETHPAKMGYLLAVVVSNRHAADSWDVFTRPEGTQNWALAKTATGKSVDLQIVPTEAGKPQQIQLFVQLKKNNQNYGQPSDIVTDTVNP